MASFDVLRPHIGDRPYAQGDTREADAASVKHLVRAGVLAAQTDGDTKKAKAPANKAAPKPANKADPAAANKAAAQE
ncbi:hypothetical protein C4N9_18500 [Pararhodobacter marinus]|uniref:Uncharacterized protein n=1 Tax=Pararhodobacter marinus TaxID=2184063 RepID=A0A2U2C533_9RHOB|nr:hypothetical protein [Pararhodobacter marinus]PWE26996.1 hypothetical protein C4N9_18500 [Pararhodobacter marinus]